jgi:hypothetical protein
MGNLLVLGLIPGTNIEISFQAWLVLMAVLPFAYKRSKPRLLRWRDEVVVSLAFLVACTRIAPYSV